MADDTSAIATSLMNDLQRDLGLTPEQAAGVVGNLMHESGGFGSLQEISPLVPGSRGGYGYAQWTGPRRDSFESYVANNGLDPTSYEANYGFLKHELQSDPYEREQFMTVKNAQTAEEAARLISQNYLRPGIPHMGKRIEYANQAMGYGASPYEFTSAGKPRDPDTGYLLNPSDPRYADAMKYAPRTMAYAPTPRPRNQNPALKAIEGALLPDLGPPGSGKSNGIGKMPKFGDMAKGSPAWGLGIMRPAQPKGGGIFTAALGGLGNLANYAGQQAAPIMRSVQTAGQNAAPSIMRAALGSVAARTAVIDPIVRRAFSNGMPFGPNTVANAQRATSQSGDTSVGNQAEAAAVRASADAWRNRH